MAAMKALFEWKDRNNQGATQKKPTNLIKFHLSIKYDSAKKCLKLL